MATIQLSDLGRRSRACSRNARLVKWDEKFVLNVPLFRAIQDAILETPHQFTMLTWRRGDVLPGAHDKASDKACIASWAVVLSDRVRLSTLPTSLITFRARQILGVRPRYSKSLFYLQAWPEEFLSPYIWEPRDYHDCVHNAHIAVARMDAFIECGAYAKEAK